MPRWSFSGRVKSMLEFLRTLSRQDAYHKLFVRRNKVTNEHVFVSFDVNTFGSKDIFLCTDGKKYNSQGECLTSSDYVIKRFVGDWTYDSLNKEFDATKI